MAKRRMLSNQIVDSDVFLDMPSSSQNLYFHLVMRADDEGFVGNNKKIMRMISASEDDLKVLIGKRFILTFKSGVIVIKHWLIHNAIRMDRFNPTTYQDEKKLLLLKENKAYTEYLPNGNQLVTKGYPKLNEVNINKVKLSRSKEFPKRKLENAEEKIPEIEEVKDLIKKYKPKFNLINNNRNDY